MQITQSAFSNANHGKSRALRPIVPRNSSFENGTTPLAMKVLATGMRSTSTKLRSDAVAPWRITPLPARITGNFAASMSRAASSILCSGATGV